MQEESNKGGVGGVAAQLNAASRHTGWPTHGGDISLLKSAAWAPLHDCLDAYLSAWVAALEEKERVPHGIPPNDVIWTPRLA